MVSDDRQRVIETNRSLRLIKNELESLLEKGVITDDAFDSITALLPAESSLAGSSSARSANPAPAPVPSVTELAAAVNNTTLSSTTNTNTPNNNNNNNNNNTPPPPSYSQSTSTPPTLPARNNPPPAPPAKPVLARARALYRYAATDARDCSFERDDVLLVHEYMNADWWMGRNERTGQEGIFPRSYVAVVTEGEGGGEKNGYGCPPPPQQQPQPQPQPQYANPGYGVGAAVGGYPAAPAYAGMAQPYQQPGPAYPPPGQPPAGEGGSSSKLEEHGKKFGKKLGNAAIFGAGATLGSNLVNSIF